MAIVYPCTCGEILEAEANEVGRQVQCPSCGEALVVPSSSSSTPVHALNYSAGGGVKRPGSWVRTPAAVPEKLRSPGMPPCYLVLQTNGADVKAEFDPSPVMDTLAEGFAKKIRKRFDVQIVQAPPPPPDASPCVVLRLVRLDEGNRLLRYFLTFFAGGTVLELQGDVRSASGKQQSIRERHKGRAGLFGGDSINLLKASAKYLGTKIAKKAMK
jgi:hypothetical protein